MDEETKNQKFDNTKNQIDKSFENEILAEESYAVKIIKRILIEAVEKKASDIFFEPLEDVFRIRYRIDGLLCEAEKYSLELAPYVINAIKVLSSLDIAEHRFPQDGSFYLHFGEKKVDFRVSTLPTNLGEKVVLRVLDKSNLKLDLDALGFDIASVEILKKNLKKPYGMILICGPTGSGKTTTLYSCLQFINSVKVNIVAVEDPVEFQLPGINQVSIQENIGLTFASALRAILRQDPNIILVGEIRDLETADIAIKASLTGHLVLSTLHTTTSTAAIIRLINMGIEPFLVATSCLVSASQALCRVLCSYCKKETDIPEIFLKELKNKNLKIPENFKYYKAVGCKFCNNTGYSGRIGIIEILEIDEKLRELLIRSEPEIKIREMAIKKGMRTLREKALEKVFEGLTTFEEVYRVTSAE
ncbi:MAG: GspE/PulE family protein [Candidatus Omnitrophica bacterium]|nr:GspE/PulE family protein [Candidatus Omnitrophota bacterium]MCM8831821.1 GspE/PulE family protein [Candidatus Omnitrophota bacterium]